MGVHTDKKGSAATNRVFWHLRRKWWVSELGCNYNLNLCDNIYFTTNVLGLITSGKKVHVYMWKMQVFMIGVCSLWFMILFVPYDHRLGWNSNVWCSKPYLRENCSISYSSVKTTPCQFKMHDRFGWSSMTSSKLSQQTTEISAGQTTATKSIFLWKITRSWRLLWSYVFPKESWRNHITKNITRNTVM